MPRPHFSLLLFDNILLQGLKLSSVPYEPLGRRPSPGVVLLVLVIVFFHSRAQSEKLE